MIAATGPASRYGDDLPGTTGVTTVGHDTLLVRLGLQARTPHQEDVPRLQPLRLLLPTNEEESVSHENITFTAGGVELRGSIFHPPPVPGLAEEAALFEIDAIAMVHEPVSTA